MGSPKKIRDLVHDISAALTPGYLSAALLGEIIGDREPEKILVKELLESLKRTKEIVHKLRHEVQTPSVVAMAKIKLEESRPDEPEED